jgi:hypothetical protein
MDFIHRQIVFKLNHALLGIGYVFAVGEPASQFGKIVIGVTGRSRVALRSIGRQEAIDKAYAAIVINQAF